MSAVVKGLRAVKTVLVGAENNGVPLPFNVSVGEHGVPLLLVWTAEQWDAWRGFLDPGAKVERHDDQLAVRGTAYEFEVEVRAVLDTVAEAKAHMAGIAGGVPHA